MGYTSWAYRVVNSAGARAAPLRAGWAGHGNAAAAACAGGAAALPPALAHPACPAHLLPAAGFGLPNRRRRVFLVASLHGDARDVLLSPGTQRCTGGCMKAFGQRCYPCHAAELRARGSHAGVSYALDMGNAM